MSEIIISKFKSQSISSQINLYINCIKTITNKHEKDDLVTQAKGFKTAIHLIWSEETLSGIFHDAELAHTGKKTNKTGFGKHPQVGMLKLMNYEVLNPHPDERKMLLDMFFNAVLPPIHNKQYMIEWGDPESPERLKKMANSISSFARNRIKTFGEEDITVKKWKDDLQYIHKFYSGDMGFHWPSTELKEM